MNVFAKTLAVNLSEEELLSKLSFSIAKSGVEKHRLREFARNFIQCIRRQLEISESFESRVQRQQLTHIDETVGRIELLFLKRHGSEQLTAGSAGRLLLAEAEYINDSALQDGVLDLESAYESGFVDSVLTKGAHLLNQVGTSAESEGLRARIHFRMALAALRSAALLDDAKQHLEKCISLGANSSVAFYCRAQISLLDKNPQSALEYVDRAISVSVDEEEDDVPIDIEFVHLKAICMSESGDSEGAMKFLEENASSKEPKLYFTRAVVASKANSPHLALDFARRGLTIDSDYTLLKVFFLEIAVSYYDDFRRSVGFIRPDDEMKVLLLESESIGKQALDELNEEQGQRRAACLQLLAYVKIWLGKPSEGLELTREAHRLTPLDEIVRNNLALLLAGEKAWDEALHLLTGWKEEKQITPELERLRLQLLIEQGKPGPVIEDLEARLPIQNLESTDVPDALLLADAYYRAYRTTDADRLTRTLSDRFGAHPLIIVERAARLERSRQLEDAVALLESELYVQTDKEKEIFLTMLARYSFQIGTQEYLSKAIAYLYLIRSVGIDNMIQKMLVESLYRVGRYHECLVVCEEVQSDQSIPFYSRLEGNVYYRHKEYQKAENKFEYVTLVNPADYQAVMARAYCLYRTGQKEVASEILAQVGSRLDDPSNMLTFAYVYADIGNYQAAAELGDKAIQALPDDAEHVARYVALWMTRNFDYSDVNPDYIRRYKDTLSAFPDRFPESAPFFETIHFDSENPQDLVSKIRKRLPDEQQIEKRNLLVQSGSLPIGAIAMMAGKDTFEVWTSLTTTPGFGFHSNLGSEEECLGEISIFNDAPKAIVIDATALLISERMNVFDGLLGLRIPLFVPQTVFDELQAGVISRRKMAAQGGGYLYPSGDSIAFAPISVDVLQSEIGMLESILSRIGDSGENDSRLIVIGESIDREDDASGYPISHYAQTLGSGNAEVLFEARARGAVLLSDDAILRRIAADNFGVETISSRSVLDVLVNKKIIPDDRYRNGILSLLEHNYWFVPLSLEVIINVLADDDYQITYRTQLIARELGRSGQRIDILLSMLSNILIHIYRTADLVHLNNPA